MNVVSRDLPSPTKAPTVPVALAESSDVTAPVAEDNRLEHAALASGDATDGAALQEEGMRDEGGFYVADRSEITSEYSSPDQGQLQGDGANTGAEYFSDPQGEPESSTTCCVHLGACWLISGRCPAGSTQVSCPCPETE